MDVLLRSPIKLDRGLLMWETSPKWARTRISSKLSRSHTYSLSTFRAKWSTWALGVTRPSSTEKLSELFWMDFKCKPPDLMPNRSSE
jgi:hypothetical protein